MCVVIRVWKSTFGLQTAATIYVLTICVRAGMVVACINLVLGARNLDIDLVDCQFTNMRIGNAKEQVKNAHAFLIRSETDVYIIFWSICGCSAHQPHMWYTLHSPLYVCVVYYVQWKSWINNLIKIIPLTIFYANNNKFITINCSCVSTMHNSSLSLAN